MPVAQFLNFEKCIYENCVSFLYNICFAIYSFLEIDNPRRGAMLFWPLTCRLGCSHPRVCRVMRCKRPLA